MSLETLVHTDIHLHSHSHTHTHTHTHMDLAWDEGRFDEQKKRWLCADAQCYTMAKKRGCDTHLGKLKRYVPVVSRGAW